MSWAEVTVKKAGYELLEMHRPKQLAYLVAKIHGFRPPPLLVTLKGPEGIRHEALPI